MQPVNNDAALQNYYMGWGGVSLAAAANDSNPYAEAAGDDVMISGDGGTSPQGSARLRQAAQIGALGQPLVWWVVIALMIAALMFGARYVIGDKEYNSIRPTVLNVLVISWVSIIGTVFWKAFFTSFPVKGVSTVVLAA